jgi:AraC-like DNA-binding protein
MTMDLSQLIECIQSEIPESRDSEGYIQSALPGLGLLRRWDTTPIEATVYEPVMCLILQGRKETRSGALRADFGAGESLVVSHDLPVVSRVTEAPYLALLLTVDRDILFTLSRDVDRATVPSGPPTSLNVARVEQPLLDALARYVALHRRPTEAQALGPLILREIHYRLLMAPCGELLRRLLSRDSNASHIARAIAIIRRDYRAKVEVPALAKEIGMSASAFHRHFKAVTGTTPLQYQKEMRLLEARRLIASAGRSVSRAALEVGYVSPSQFSREYSRKFGVSPRLELGTV